jgi:hypothetical protein
MQQNIAFYFFILATFLTEKHCFWQLKTSKTFIFDFLISLLGKISPVKKNLLGVEISPILRDKKKFFQNCLSSMLPYRESVVVSTSVGQLSETASNRVSGWFLG